MNQSLRSQVLTVLDMTADTPAEQDAVLGRIGAVADSRLARLVPQLLSTTQLAELANHRQDDSIRWAARHIPRYVQLVRAVVLDVADEVADINRVHAVAPSSHGPE